MAVNPATTNAENRMIEVLLAPVRAHRPRPAAVLQAWGSVAVTPSPDDLHHTVKGEHSA
jgi:hypothetical protein